MPAVPVPPPQPLHGFLVTQLSPEILHALFAESPNALGTAAALAMQHPGKPFAVFHLIHCAVATPGSVPSRRKEPPPLLTAIEAESPAQKAAAPAVPPVTRALIEALRAYLATPPQEADASLNTAHHLLTTLLKE